MSQQIESHVLALYKIIKRIGSGAYGHVYKVIDRKTKKIKALKKNFDAFINSTDAQRTYREIMFLMELKHPNVIIMDEVIPSINGKDIYLVFEYMDADLYLLIRQNILAEKHRKYILYQIAKALLYLHSGGLIHRDLKPSNILVNEACEAKLCDFGLVRSVDDVNNNDKFNMLTEYIATRWYRAPEILLASCRYSKEVDIWGFGCLAAEMAKGKPLFPGTSTINQLERVIMWTGQPTQSDIQSLNTNFKKQMLDILFKTKKMSRKQYFPSIDIQYLDLIQKCLQLNPTKRIKIEQIIKHKYLHQFYIKQQLIICNKKIKIPIDDNCRLSLKDYRGFIYQQIKKNHKNYQQYPILQFPSHQSVMYRIREKHKKNIKTQQSDYLTKQSINYQPPKKQSINYENESKTVNIKKNEHIKKKMLYKGESLGQKNLKILEEEQDKYQNKLDVKDRQKSKLKKLKQQLQQSRKIQIFKQSNHYFKHQFNGNGNNKVKRSLTEGNNKKQCKMFNTNMDVINYFRK